METLGQENAVLVKTCDLANAAKKSIRILHVDDDQAILSTSKQILIIENDFEIDQALNVKEAETKLKSESYDAVICDYEMPGKNGLQFLKELRQTKTDIPFILFTGKGREEVAVEALNLGADGYYNKHGNIEVVYGELAHAIKLAVDRCKARRALDESEKRYRTFMDQAVDAIFVHDLNGRIIDFNQKACINTGYTKKELLSMTVHDFDPAVTSKVNPWSKLHEGQSINFEGVQKYKNGKIVHVEVSLHLITVNEKKAVIATVRDISERKKSEEALRASEARFRKLVENAPYGVYVTDMEGKLVDGNLAAAKLIGCTKEEVSGKKLLDLGILDEKNAAKALREVQEAMQGRPTGPTEYELKKKNGKISNVELSSFLINLENEKHEFVGIMKDITERKKAEEELRINEERFRSVLNNSADSISRLNLQTHSYEYISPSCKRVLDLEPEEMAILKDEEFLSNVHPEDIAKAKIAYSQAFSSGKALVEYRFRVKDGSFRWVSNAIIVTKDAGGVPIYLDFFARDVTERKIAEQNQCVSEQKYQSLFESTPDAIIVYDAQGVIESANQAAAAMLGYQNPVELVGKPGYTLSEDPQELRQLTLLTSENGYVKDYEAKMKKSNGDTIDVNLTLTVQKDSQGKRLRYESIIRNVTESKKAQEALKQRTEQLEITQKKLEENAVLLEEYANQMEGLAEERARKLKESERFATIGATAAMVGHDLRNPLSGIKNAAYILKVKGASISRVQAEEMLGTIERCVEHSNKIINDLLDYSKQISLELQEVSPRQLLTDALAMINVPETVNILNHVSETPLLEVDPDKIKRVFVNLVKNAADAMSNVGRLTVESKQEDSTIQISFADTGPGIPDDVLPRLFSPLFTTKAQGMGFGLAICKRIVEAHGGTISIKTAIGEGTTFTISLPLKNPYSFYENC